MYIEQFKKAMETNLYAHTPLTEVSPGDKYDVILARTILEIIYQLEQVKGGNA